MQADEIESIAKIFVDNGVNKIRLTGGEPLVRKDAADIILRLSKLGAKITLTTNATRLHDFVDVLKEANIRSLNISLDTLNKDRFLLMTKRDQYERVRNNIDLMIDQGIHVKVNMVVMKGLNDDEINDFIRWTKTDPIHVRFIEFMPFTGNQWESGRVFTLQQILERATAAFDILPLDSQEIPGAGPQRNLCCHQYHERSFLWRLQQNAPYSRWKNEELSFFSNRDRSVDFLQKRRRYSALDPSEHTRQESRIGRTIHG
jgi:molybdenum cofactor biosynthesis enzyme MoaA